ncbi:ribonuclease YeeF family protein [Bacillus sp. T33-2]|uniref:ribonuclease YeeF family protein n=1 Tax=Bacillus sp. T33-2 TaxID=2054168 RepID=UPI000C77C339|nr:T7SS effector LXG polymorphic toxin [Bacillus sp. T33-2]PLR95916.1 transposase [Bacillus sp. T33-2]
MKVLKAEPFLEGISLQQQTLTRLEGEMEAILKAAESFAGMEEALKGKGGGALRSFYKDCHVPFIQYFITFKNQFNTTLDQIQSALNSLEPHPSGVIRQHFLEGELQAKLNELKHLTESLTDEGNAIINTVSDIVSLPKLDDSSFQDGVRRAMKKIEDTISDLHEFDRTQTNALDVIDEDIIIMEQWLADLEGMVTDGLVNSSFPAEQWKEYSSVSPLTTELAKRMVNTGSVGEGTEKDNTGNVAGAIPFMLAAKDHVGNAKKANTAITGAISSFRMYMAGKNNGLSITKVYNPNTGKYSYRLHATGKALRALGIEPDSKAYKELMAGVPKGSKRLNDKHYKIAADNKATLKYATKKPGQSGWSGVGDEVLKSHPSLDYWNDKATTFEKAKTVGKATLSGAGKSFKDAVDFKGIVTSGPVKGATKALGPLSAGLTYYSNHNSAKEAGLSGEQAVKRVAVDTSIDMAVSGAVQAGSVAFFTAAIPIPGVGTAVGVAFGIAANTMLNSKDKKTGKSIMDNIKGWFH